MDESLQDFPKLFVGKMIKDWMFDYVKVVSRFSNVAKWNKESDYMESMLIAREKRKNIISYVDYSKFCHMIRRFPGLNQTFCK